MENENLFLLKNNTKTKIDSAIVDKYKLSKGDVSPFSGNTIVNERGEGVKRIKNTPAELPDDDNTQMFSTAESIDIAQGVDSTE